VVRRLNGRYSWPVLFTAAVVLACAGVAAGQQFQYTTIWVPGSIDTIVYGVNDTNVSVGTYETPEGAEYGFIRTGQTITNLQYPGEETTIPFDVNNAGEVVGEYPDAASHFHAFLYANATYTNIDPPGAVEAAASGINNVGQIVGEYSIVGQQQGFILDAGSYQFLSVPGSALTTWAGGINDSGQVTLQWVYAESNTTQSSLYDGSNYTQIEVPGAYNVFAYAINNRGSIAITWQDDDLFNYCALRAQGPGGYIYPSLDVPGSEGGTTLCYGLNNKSDAVGRYTSTKAILAFGARPSS